MSSGPLDVIAKYTAANDPRRHSPAARKDAAYLGGKLARVPWGTLQVPRSSLLGILHRSHGYQRHWLHLLPAISQSLGIVAKSLVQSTGVLRISEAFGLLRASYDIGRITAEAIQSFSPQSYKSRSGSSAKNSAQPVVTISLV